MARNRFSRLEECKLLLSKLLEKRSHMQSAFYVWIDPKTRVWGNGAYPFKDRHISAEDGRERNNSK